MRQQIIINVTEKATGGGGTPPNTPNTGFLSGITDSISSAASNNLGLIISLILLTILIATGIILSRKHLHTSKRKLSFLSLFLIPIAIFTISTTTPIQAATDLILSTNGTRTINVEQGETKTGMLTTTVTTSNTTGYILTASLNQNSIDTLTNNNIDFSLSGTDVVDQIFTVPDQDEEIFYNPNPATNELTEFIITVQVPSTISTGTYHVYLNYTATDNDPTPLPAGIDPINVSLAVDIYPTTGWQGDYVALMSNSQFTDVTGVTIDGAPCGAYSVINTGLIACQLPSKTAGTKADISVLRSTGGDFDMNGFKVQYFDPARTELIGANQSDHITFDTFDSIDCSNLLRTPGQNDGQIVYLTDTRNKQTYPVRKMADDKCWMIDNMKYLGEGLIINNYDSTTGIFLRDATHPGANGSGQYNTINGTNTQSATNSDKAFYNTPMTNAYCYGSGASYSVRTSTTTGCGYLYNWYAATNTTGTYGLGTAGNTAQGSICPANTHLPRAFSGTAIDSTDTTYTDGEFAVLNMSMKNGTPSTGAITNDATTQPGWQPDGSFAGVFSGSWSTTLNNQSSSLGLWSSSVNSATNARSMYFYSSNVNPGSNVNSKYYGFAVRCVL